jgi:hypothetical protein
MRKSLLSFVADTHEGPSDACVCVVLLPVMLLFACLVAEGSHMHKQQVKAVIFSLDIFLTPDGHVGRNMYFKKLISF